jgi:hypothetical protein
MRRPLLPAEQGEFASQTNQSFSAEPMFRPDSTKKPSSLSCRLLQRREFCLTDGQEGGACK